MKIPYILSAFLLIGSTVAANASTASSRDSAVLSAVIQRNCAMAARSSYGEVQVIPSKTDTIEVSSFSKSFNKSAIQSLLARNAVRHDLPRVEMCLGFKVIASAKINKLFQSEANPAKPVPMRQPFHQSFPKAAGILSLSLPGYSESGQLAVVQVSYACGSLCGSGEYWILHNVKGKWVVVSRSPAWVS